MKMEYGRDRWRGDRNLTNMPLEKLVVLALERNLVDDWRFLEGCIQLRAGIMEVTLSERQARIYLAGLIRAHDQTHSGTNEWNG